MNSKSLLESGSFFRRAIFAAVLLGIFTLYTVFSFDGLTSKTGIDQAQVAREVARGNGLTTKMVRPISIQQLIENDKEVNLKSTPETYHSPLNILVYAGVIKMIGGDDSAKYDMGKNDKFYRLDQAIAMTCATFFLIAIGINYLLISRIFDQKIAAIVALIMVLSEYMWSISQSGLPQMLMLSLFSAGAYLAWRAVEAQEAGSKSALPALLSGFFFGLLVLAHWMTLWIFIGYFIFATFYFRPRGVVALGLVAIILTFIAGPLVFYYIQTGEPLGLAFHAIHGAGGGVDSAMRQVNTSGFNVKGLLMRTAQTTLIQTSNIHNYLGGLILAPAFFLALAHPFKRSSIAVFRWVILLMWIFASVGMAIYGLSDSQLDPNQMHLLFAPLMCAYAIALISIIWERCPLSKQQGPLGSLHFVIILLVSAGPLLLHIKQLTKNRNPAHSVNGVHAYSLNSSLKSVTSEKDLIISDQPWAVAWYADRHAIWTPQSVEQLKQIESIASKRTPVTGIHSSSMSYRGEDIKSSLYKNRDLTPLAYSFWVSYFANDTNAAHFKNNVELNALVDPQKGRYPHSLRLVGGFEPSTYYASSPISLKK